MKYIFSFYLSLNLTYGIVLSEFLGILFKKHDFNGLYLSIWFIEYCIQIKLSQMPLLQKCPLVITNETWIFMNISNSWYNLYTFVYIRRSKNYVNLYFVISDIQIFIVVASATTILTFLSQLARFNTY